MSHDPAIRPLAVIVGLGRTGVSCARHLLRRGYDLAATDSRAEPPGLGAFRELAPLARVRTGGFDTALLDGAALVVASPGVSLAEPIFAAARARGIDVAGDIELFARVATAPTVAITGTNGKSTVTTLLGRMAARAGLRTAVGGNLGTPALELLDSVDPQLYVLELSSFQLEAVHSLRLVAGAVLNVTSDHMDRYEGMAAYAAAKARIFMHCDTAVVNLDDEWAAAMVAPPQRAVGFSLRAGTAARWSIATQPDGTTWLTRDGKTLLASAEMRLAGLHNVANALAALALGEAAGLDIAAMLEELREFPGLAHRSQWVAEVRGVRYVNDSKGTNVGATLAAVAGMPGTLVVIAGGDGKNQDFAPLAPAFAGRVRLAVLIGRDAPALAAALDGACPVARCESLEQAVTVAASAAQPGDTVLLSPACASLDMFRDYTHRGDVFAASVRRLAA
jgi:UDP-N-acetylmuramoylalanine--D-glutamate ligase